MHPINWRPAARVAVTALVATSVYGATTAVAQTGTPAQATTPAATSPTEVAATGPAIAANGTENIPNAGTNTCFARLFKPKDANVPEQFKAEDEIVVQYRIRCSSPVSAYTVSLGRDISGIEAELFVTYLNGNSVIKDQAFNCGSEIPGPGINCVGSYKGSYNTIRGLLTVPLTDAEVKAKASFCSIAMTPTLSTFTSEVSRDQFTGAVKKNADGTSQIVNYAAGPYRITRPQCHKGAKKSAAAASARR